MSRLEILRNPLSTVSEPNELWSKIFHVHQEITLRSHSRSLSIELLIAWFFPRQVLEIWTSNMDFELNKSLKNHQDIIKNWSGIQQRVMEKPLYKFDFGSQFLNDCHKHINLFKLIIFCKFLIFTEKVWYIVFFGFKIWITIEINSETILITVGS